MEGLEAEIARTRAAMGQVLARALDDAGPDAREALQSLSMMMEELEVSAEELAAASTELAEARTELTDSYDRYRDLFDRAPEPLVVTTLDGTVREANRLAARLFRTSVDRLVGSHLARWVPAGLRPAIRDALAAAGGGQTLRGLELELSDAGSTSVVHASLSRVLLGNGAAEIRWVLADGTAAVRARAELRRLADEAEQTSDELRTTGDWQAALLGAAAHDLANPLTVISTALETVLTHRDRIEPALRDELLERAFAQSTKLRRLLPSLLELSELQLRNGVARRSRVELAPLMASVLRTLDVRDHEVVLELGVRTLVVDALALERIVENLLVNALRHSPAGTTVTVGARVTEDGGSVLLLVDDEGPGVPPELREQVFLPFMQTHDDQEHGASGLGLAIVAMFAAMHGGRAWVEDAPGGGAGFRVLLANAEPEPNAEPAP